jgi:hypothetical protein
MKQKLIILNLISVFVVAFGLTTFLHELAHAITAKFIGIESILFHSYVSYDNSKTSAINQIYILSSGPLFSFLQAIAFIMLLRKKSKFDFIGLFYLWMGIIGMVVFLGYIMMGPFMPYGDTGKIYAILSIPNYVSISLSILALIVIIFFFRKLTPVFSDFLFNLKAASEFEKQKSYMLFFLLPIALGTIINVLTSLPAPTMMSLAFPLVIPLALAPSAIRLKKTNWFSDKESSRKNDFSKTSYWSIIAMILIIVISRILTIGIKI